MIFLKLVINPFFIIFFIIFFTIFFFIYIKISKNLLAKYYQEKKKTTKHLVNLSKAKRKIATIWLWTIQNLPEDEKQKPVEYRWKYYRREKKCRIVFIGKYWFKK